MENNGPDSNNRPHCCHFLHDGHWLPTFWAKHPGAEQCLYPPTVLTSATASFPEIFVCPHTLFLSGEGQNIERYPFALRFWSNRGFLCARSQITQRFLRVGNTTVCIIFRLSRIAPSAGYLDCSLGSQGCPEDLSNSANCTIVGIVGSLFGVFCSRPSRSMQNDELNRMAFGYVRGNNTSFWCPS
jgi:hypothetical protein